jgi:hypothetical protein
MDLASYFPRLGFVLAKRSSQGCPLSVAAEAAISIMKLW